MSQFLGPIHHLMFEKIQNQERFVAALLEPEALQALDQSLPQAQSGKLEEVVDPSNIHGWLSSQIERVEKRLAYALQHTSAWKIAMQEQGLDFARSYGASQVQTASELHALLNRILLDGMPCEFAMQVECEDPDQLRYTCVEDVHRAYELEAGGEGTRYAQARLAWVDAFLTQTPFVREEAPTGVLALVRRSV